MKILVVDDQPAIRAAVVETVRARGGEPVACADAASARAAIAAEPFPVVLLDLGLPDEDGLSLCRWLRTHPHGIVSAVIGITGSLEPEVLQNLLDAGADDFLPKPFRADLLDIRIAIAERKARDNAARLRALAELARGERERQERELRDATERFRALVTKSSELISVIGLDGSRRYISPSAEWLLGYPPDELIGADRLGLLAEDDLPAAEAAFRELIADPAAHPTLTVRLLHKDGTYRTFEAIGTNMLDDPSVGGMVWVARDMTEREEAERRLARALEMEQVANRQLTELNRAKSDFVSIVSHEFRTPLTSIQGFAELIKDGELDQAMTREFAGLIHDEALRLGRLITEMLDLDRIESGRVNLSLSRVDLTPVLEAAIDRIAPNAPAHRFVREWQRPLPPAMADSDKITRVFSNLLSNAVKYSPKGGTVAIGGGERDGRIALWVRDEGMGIPADLLEAIFERYARVEGGAHRPIQGTGLGLAIVRQIVAMHGGSVTVASQVGQGSTFTVCLPIDGPLARASSDQPVLATADLAKSSNIG